MKARLAALLLSLVAVPAFAECNCLWRGSFVDIQGDTDLVTSATVIATRGNSIDLQLNQILRGEEYREQVRIWLDTGDLCRAETGRFELDSTWVMALDRIDEVPPGGFNPSTPNVSYGRVGDYSLSRCGGYWLRQAENLVSGNLVDGTRWEMNPKMSPVLIDLVAGFVAGELDAATLKQASEVDPELQKLILETRLFLRQSR